MRVECSHVSVNEGAQTNRAFGTGHCSRQVEFGARPPDPLSDGLWTTIINDCRERERERASFKMILINSMNFSIKNITKSHK